MARASDEAAVAELRVSADRSDWRDVSPTVASVDVEDHDSLTDKAVVVLDDPGGVLADASFEGLFVRLALGWQAQRATLFEGVVTATRVLAQPEGQRIELTTLDFTHLMTRNTMVPSEWRSGERLSDVLTRLVSRPDYHISVKQVEPTDDTPSDRDRPRASVNEWEFVLDQARRQACKTFVEFDGQGASNFYFVPVERLASAEPVGELRYCRGIGELVSFDFERISTGAMPARSASTIDHATGAVVNQPAPPEQPRPPVPAPATGRNPGLTGHQRTAVESLTELAAAAAARLRQPTERVTGQAADPAAAAQRVQPDPTRRLGLNGRGVAIGNVGLRAKSRVRISGVAPWAEGDWYLTKVNHVFSRERIGTRYRSTYSTRFTATR